MRRQIENIIANAEEFTIDDSVDEILDLFSVMLSKFEKEIESEFEEQSKWKDEEYLIGYYDSIEKMKVIIEQNIYST